ncbi:putative quinol monooxygenase [Pigmentiphaga aceris]|nr:putative quinol monooxygenase [Pigmentiphaga aceris]
MHQVTNLAIARAKSGCSDELGELLMTLVTASRAEAGCVAYEVHRANDDGDMWMLYETWESPAHVNKHFQSAHMRDFALASKPLVEGAPDLHSFTRICPSQWPVKA